eukprot:492538-Rhodomonas_salina.1
MDQALLLGGSGDVCAWRRGPQEPGWDIESPHGWMLAAQPRKVSTRSGLRKGERPLNAVLAAFQFQVKARVKSLAFGPIRRAHALSVRLRHRDTRPLRHAPALQLKLRCAEGWALRE